MATDNNSSEMGISPLYIQDEMKNSYLDYAMSVIVGRALPDVRDGFKPVHRRILYSMHALNNYHNRPYMKSARVVGEVIGKYHPHGDSSVYSAIVRLAQDFSMRYQLVDGQGNFGSIDGDNAAAMRYTEVRMQKMSEELLRDIDKETVSFRPNYDDSLKEPSVLPTKVPNLLINGSTGIAVGMATNIPPHNLTEVLDALTELVNNPDLTLPEIFQIIPGPDFPTAGIIQGTNGIKQAYFTGKGVIQIRAKAEIEINDKGTRERIIVTELPYQVLKSKFIERVAHLVNSKELTGISDIRDESNRLGIRVVIDLKRGEQANVILNRLYKQTQLQVSYGIIFLALVNGRPKVMNIKELLQAFIDHRREIIVRRTRYELKKAKEKAHILEGLKVAVENIDAVIKLIKESSGPQVAREALMAKYALSEKQAQAILDMRLQKLTGLEMEKILQDYKDILALIEKLSAILASDELVSDIIRNEFNELREKYGDERKTFIQASEEEIEIEDLIKDEEVIVTVTKKGYIKRMAIDTYKAQKRGGKGVKGADFEDDYYTNIFTANTLSSMMFFTDKGTVFSLKVYQLPEGARTARGRNIVNLLNIPAGETVREIFPVPENVKESSLVICTKNGTIKKSFFSDYKRIKQNGLKAIKIVDNDSVLRVKVAQKGDDILIGSSGGKVIRFSEEDCRAQGRVSQGVKGIQLSKSETVIGMEVLESSSEGDILSVTELGFGKRTKISEYRQQSRGGKGILAMKLTDRTGSIVENIRVKSSDDLVIITNKGQVIRMSVSDISCQGRNTQGVRLMKLKPQEKVVSVEIIAESEGDS